MALPYTPLQYAVRHVEEDGAPAESLDGMPVVAVRSIARSCRFAPRSKA